MDESKARPQAPTLQERTEQALAGGSLYGDDFSADEIALWFDDEREGYYNLYFRDAPAAAASPDQYEYEALAERHAYRWLPTHPFQHALGVGSAHGAELLPVLQRSQRLTILEPSDGFAATELHGKPVRYVKPDPSGLMTFDDASFDLAICFSVLHHIPNVSTVVSEMHRVLRPGGWALLREPTHSMGDWRRPRPGLTRRERGIPVDIFRRILKQTGFEVVRETRCNFSLLGRLQRAVSRPIWTVPWVVRLDAWLCKLPVWSHCYHPTTAWQKLRPTGVTYVLRKPLR